MADENEAEKKQSMKEYQRVYYVNNKERLKKYNLEYYLKNREKIAEKYRTKYISSDGLLTTYHMDYYKKNKEKIRKYYNERYKTKGIEWYLKNKKEILLKKREKYKTDKNQSLLSLGEKKEDYTIDISNIYIPKSSCQAKTNEIIKNLEIMKMKAEAFKKSLNNN
jgi:hypothetical protein